MDEKLEKKDYEKLVHMIRLVWEQDALRRADELRIIDILLDACRREKAAVEEDIMVRMLNTSEDQKGGDRGC